MTSISLITARAQTARRITELEADLALHLRRLSSMQADMSRRTVLAVELQATEKDVNAKGQLEEKMAMIRAELDTVPVISPDLTALDAAANELAQRCAEARSANLEATRQLNNVEYRLSEIEAGKVSDAEAPSLAILAHDLMMKERQAGEHLSEAWHAADKARKEAEAARALVTRCVVLRRSQQETEEQLTRLGGRLARRYELLAEQDRLMPWDVEVCKKVDALRAELEDAGDVARQQDAAMAEETGGAS